MARIVRYVNFYPPCDASGAHPWRTTSWVTWDLAEANKKPGRLTVAPVRVEFDSEAESDVIRDHRGIPIRF